MRVGALACALLCTCVTRTRMRRMRRAPALLANIVFLAASALTLEVCVCALSDLYGYPPVVEHVGVCTAHAGRAVGPGNENTMNHTHT